MQLPTGAGALRALCASHTGSAAVTPVADGGPYWIQEGGRLRHSEVDYFSIGLYEFASGASVFMMEQEPALIMQIVADVDGVESVLLSLRTEPGLIGLTNLTSTIQSTPGNYLRRHGGKPTPFIEVAVDPHSFGTVIHDTEQYDWGSYYIRKTKRFLIVKLAEAVTAPPGFLWIDTATARKMLWEDHLITSDLRVALSYLCHVLDRGQRDSGVPALFSRRAATDRSCHFTGQDFSPRHVDSLGNRVAFFRTETQTREVQCWTQPLLLVANPVEICLPFATTASGRIFAVEERRQAGLMGERLWFPGTADRGRVVRHVSTSAEGGRFWRHRVDLALIEVDPPRMDADPRVVWLTGEQLANLVAEPARSSLELRLAFSLAA